jgi:hypothetical protein
MSSVNSPNMTGNCRRTYRRRRPGKECCNVGLGTPDLVSGPEVVMDAHSISPPKRIPTAQQYLVQESCRPGGVHEPTSRGARSQHLKANNSSAVGHNAPHQNHIPPAPSKILSAGFTPRSGGQSGSPRTSAYFAGSKFGDAPPPTILPPPPPHWLSGMKSCQSSVAASSKEEFCVGLTSGLKILLHVQ